MLTIARYWCWLWTCVLSGNIHRGVSYVLALIQFLHTLQITLQTPRDIWSKDWEDWWPFYDLQQKYLQGLLHIISFLHIAKILSPLFWNDILPLSCCWNVTRKDFSNFPRPSHSSFSSNFVLIPAEIRSDASVWLIWWQWYSLLSYILTAEYYSQ